MEEKEGTIVFVTIGVPFSKIPIMQKVMVWVDTEDGTVTQAAKALRKRVADNIENHGWVKGTNFTPAELYYEVYGSVDSDLPIRFSANAPVANRAC